MQHSRSSWPNTRTSYYNPVSKIRTLINNLDVELMQLCNQCSLPKSVDRVHNAAVAVTPPITPTGSSASAASNTIPITTTPAPIAMDAIQKHNTQQRTLAGIYRARVIEAYRNRRIFTVYGNYHTIRRALLRRGWLEKLAPGRYPKLQGLSEDVLLQHAKRGNDFEAVAISRIINHFPSFFIWQPKGQRDVCSEVLPHRNRVRRNRCLDFSTKVGLIGCAELEQWYHMDPSCGNMRYPRFYRLGGNLEERIAFIHDFRQTQYRSLLRFIIESADNLSQIMDSQTGTVLPTIITFAITRVKRQLSEWENNDVDNDHLITSADSENIEWENFLRDSKLIIQRKAKFKATENELMDYVKVARLLLDRLQEKRPDYKWDGCRNLWILKPGFSCRGIGIIIRNTLDELLQWANNNTNRRYIAQKYVERPLLIYKTKFDIRQYMLLVVGESKVTIWLYKDCYLRFSSQEFSIDDLRESIHLTNNSVQKKYKNKISRDPRLPPKNMWSLEQFKIYLNYLEAPPDVWESKVFNGFKNTLTTIVSASLEETDFIENAFEMYGCDFMLDEEYNPILIEINSTPDLTPSTDVTARICPMALKDLIKVVIDLPKNPRTPTGLFEKIYEVDYRIKRDPALTEGHALDVYGRRMTLFKPIRIASPRSFRKPIILMKKPEKFVPPPKKPRKLPITTTPRQDKIKAIETKSMVQPLRSSTKQVLALRYTIPQ